MMGTDGLAVEGFSPSEHGAAGTGSAYELNIGREGLAITLAKGERHPANGKGALRDRWKFVGRDGRIAIFPIGKDRQSDVWRQSQAPSQSHDSPPCGLSSMAQSNSRSMNMVASQTEGSTGTGLK